MDAFDISASALLAERTRMTVIAQNVANANTTRDRFGEVLAYRRKEVLFQPGVPEKGEPFWGVHTPEIVDDWSEQPRVYKPGHPDADSEGYVTMPNVDMQMEMADLLTASRAYQANIAAMEATKEIWTHAGRIIQA